MKLTPTDAAGLYAKGMSVREIAQAYRLMRHRVEWRIRTAGLPGFACDLAGGGQRGLRLAGRGTGGGQLTIAVGKDPPSRGEVVRGPVSASAVR